MKRATLYLTVILAFALCPILSQAQAMLRANIPFDFTVGTATMSSGVYDLSNAGNHVQLLRNPDTNRTAFVSSLSIGNPYKIDLSKNVLIFHRYGSEYVLTEIWASGVGEAVRQPKRATELAKSGKPEKVMVAMVVSK